MLLKLTESIAGVRNDVTSIITRFDEQSSKVDNRFDEQSSKADIVHASVTELKTQLVDFENENRELS